MVKANLVERLGKCRDFSCVFGIVKEAVEKSTGERRGGLLLGLLPMPDYIGAFYQVGSNFIVMNKKLLEDVFRTKNRELINAYIFHILLHEYLHSLGYLNERETSLLAEAVSEQNLGSDHPATLIAKHGIGYVLQHFFSRIPDRPSLEYENETFGQIEVIDDFEVDELGYLG